MPNLASDSPSDSAPQTPPIPPMGKPAFRLAFAWVAVVHAVLMVLQPILAGASLQGSMVSLDVHFFNGMAIMTLAFVLVAIALLWWKPGGGPSDAISAAGFLAALEVMQFAFGNTFIYAVHLPLGIILLIGSFALVRMGFRTTPRQRKPRGSKSRGSKSSDSKSSDSKSSGDDSTSGPGDSGSGDGARGDGARGGEPSAESAPVRGSEA